MKENFGLSLLKKCPQPKKKKKARRNKRLYTLSKKQNKKAKRINKV